jgi:hypothetical protein
VRRRGAAGLLALIVGALLAAGPAGAAPSPPVDIRVDGGSERWHADPRFDLRWEIPEAAPPVVAVHFRVKRPDGSVFSEARIDEPAKYLTVRVPDYPGVYTGEVWLEDGAGAQGAVAAAQLRYDDLPPQGSRAESPPPWLGRTAFPLVVRLQHPGAPLPASGILGYAISIDRDPLATPCADLLLCSPQETDLQGGINADSLEVPQLPEGVSYVHSLAVSGSGVRSREVGHRLYRVDLTDPVSAVEGVPPDWVNRSVGLTAHATDEGSGMSGGGAFTAIRIDDAAPATRFGGEVEATVIGEGVHSVAYYARDAAGNVNDGARSNTEVDHPPATATVSIDRTPPRVYFSNSQSPQDPELIRARVDDPLSGASLVSGVIGIRPAGSGDSFEALATTRSELGLSARWDTSAYPEGSYEFRAVGGDAAGNSATSTSRADGSPMVLANPLKATTLIVAGLGHAARRARVLPFGRVIRLKGRLTTGARRPIGGAAVRIVERYGGRIGNRTLTSVTDESGRFSVALPAGPSREVVASFAGDLAFAHAAGDPARLLVRSAASLRVSAPVATVGGRPLVFRGVVRSRPGELPLGGKTVELQFRAPGLGWQEFRTLETNRRGRFRYAYRFSDDDSRGARFEFRAHVPQQAGWPYEPGDSRPVAVRGA